MSSKKEKSKKDKSKKGPIERLKRDSGSSSSSSSSPSSSSSSSSSSNSSRSSKKSSKEDQHMQGAIGAAGDALASIARGKVKGKHRDKNGDSKRGSVPAAAEQGQRENKEKSAAAAAQPPPAQTTEPRSPVKPDATAAANQDTQAAAAAAAAPNGGTDQPASVDSNAEQRAIRDVVKPLADGTATPENESVVDEQKKRAAAQPAAEEATEQKGEVVQALDDADQMVQDVPSLDMTQEVTEDAQLPELDQKPARQSVGSKQSSSRKSSIAATAGGDRPKSTDAAAQRRGSVGSASTGEDGQTKPKESKSIPRRAASAGDDDDDDSADEELAKLDPEPVRVERGPNSSPSDISPSGSEDSIKEFLHPSLIRLIRLRMPLRDDILLKLKEETEPGARVPSIH